MAYEHLLNAVCVDGLLRYRWKSLGFHDGAKSMSAIDELGRIFSWGQNWYGHSGQGNPCYNGAVYTKPELTEIESATQVGSERNWIKSCAGEHSTVALNFDGELWGWGLGGYQCSAFGLPTDSGEGNREWEGVPPALYQADYFFTPARVAPGFLCKDVAHDYYHTLAIGMDDKLYVWGSNIDYCLGIGGTPTEGGPPYAGLQHTPLLHPFLTDDIKLIHCHLLTSMAVTLDNRVYIWGETWWWACPAAIEAAWDSQTPIEVTGLPGGCDIVDCYCCGYGLAVLLSNGEVWAAGDGSMFGDDYAAYPVGTATFERVDVLVGKNIVKLHVGAMGGLVVYCVEDDGNVWGWGDAWYFSGNEGPEDYTCRLMISNFEGEHSFIDAGACSHQNGFFAIDIYGYLWSWGSQGWSSILAVGVDNTEVYLQKLAQRTAEAFDYKGESALLNIYPQWESEYHQPLPQLADHEPCGHWYVRLWEMAEEWPKNCWMTSMAVRDGIVFFIVAGRYPDISDDKGFDLIFMTYDISHNVWTRMYWDEMIFTALAPGGAAFHGDVYAYFNYKADVSGTAWNNTYTNPALGVWVLSPTGLEYTEFNGAISEQFGENKVGVRSNGLVAIAYEDSADDLVVQVSTDFGATWNLRHTIAADVKRKDFSLVIDDNDHIYLAYQLGPDTEDFAVERSINNGLNWTVQRANQDTNVEIATLKLTVEGVNFYVFVSSATEFRALFSVNSCATFGSKSYDDGTHVASGKTIGSDEYVATVTRDKVMYFYAYDDSYGGWKWNPSTVPSPKIVGEAIDLTPHVVDAVMVGDGGIFVYASYSWYIPGYDAVMLLISEDMGANWYLRETPLTWYKDWSEITSGEICPIWKLPGEWVFEKTDWDIDSQWTFEKSNWAEDFKKQQDKLQPCEDFE